MITNVLKFIATDFFGAIRLFIAFLRGCLAIVYFRLFRRKVRIKFPFFIHAKLQIIGPGSIYIDKFCSVHRNVFSGLSIITLSPHALVSIGKHCVLGGLTIRCHDRVDIDDHVLTAYSLIQDVLFISPGMVKSRGNMQDLLSAASIEVKTNVWIGAQACILKGSGVGKDSVVSFGTVCYRDKIKDYHLVAGNPTVKPLPIANILALKGQP